MSLARIQLQANLPTYCAFWISATSIFLEFGFVHRRSLYNAPHKSDGAIAGQTGTDNGPGEGDCLSTPDAVRHDTLNRNAMALRASALLCIAMVHHWRIQRPFR
jgi:hypothetical protein